MKRKTTRLIPFYRGKCLPVALMTLALASANVALAQTNPWVGEALPAEGGDFYLFNKAGNGFLLGANTWGTQGSLGQPGLACTLAVSNGKYKIVTNAGKAGNGLGSDGYVDNGTPAEYVLTDPTPDDGLNEYTIALDGKYFYWGGEGTVLKLDGEGSAEEPQWLLVSKGQRESKLDEATKDNGVDATFYIIGAGFDRAQPGAWQVTNDGGTTNLCGPNGSANNHYYCAEAYNNNSFDIYQELTGIRNGRYRVTCQGFYRSDDGARNAMIYAGLNESPLLQGVDDGNGMPNNMASAANAFAEGRYSGNVVEVIVMDGTLRFGIKKSMHVANDWAIFDNFRLTYLGEATAEEAFADLLGALQNVQQEFETGGATAIVAELQAIYDQYADASGDFAEAQEVVTTAINSANAVRSVTMTLSGALTSANEYMARVENGEVILNEAAKSALQEAITAASKVLAETSMAGMADVASDQTTALNTAVSNAQTWAALSYPLTSVKALADKIGTLSATTEYQKVATDLQAADLTYDDMVLDVAALTALCRNNMSSDFLAGASEKDPLDLTCFITNPNIYQNGETNQYPGGWLGVQGRRDNSNYTTKAHGDAELNAYNWSGNLGNDVTGTHYYQKIGGDGEGAVSLPDGLYELRAATYANTDPKKIILYASSDSVNFDTVFFNMDRTLYDAALKDMTTTSTVQNVVVKGGQLYVGARGEDPVNNHQSGLGKSWNADNFRLYFMGSDVLGAYRERLRGRLYDGQILHDSLMVCGIDDSDYLGWALDKEDEDSYVNMVDDESATEEDILWAIDDMDSYITDAYAILANFDTINPLVVNGKMFEQQLKDGSLSALPTAKETFLNALHEAIPVAEDMTWKNYLSEDVSEQSASLKEATTLFMNSVAFCYQMGTAKVLADQIGGLDNTQAYQNVVAALASDELDPLDADLFAQELQRECIDAMTPEVLGRATVEEPFNMTTFIVNPNIFQDAKDPEGNDINTEINGWVCETNADNALRTSGTSGDTWLSCNSWSGNAGHNIASATNYRQIVGTQPTVSEEGKFQLPTGAYRVEAATFVSRQPENIALYAQTNSVESSTVQSSTGEDSTVYVYTEIEAADSAFNASNKVWDAALASLGTTTVVPEIYVDNGAVTVGIRGRDVIGGTGSYWNADNFRLYYIGTERGSGIGDVIADKAGRDSEIVDVYDITGKLVRRQVRRTDAVKGLKRGIYIAGGMKYVVSGK